MTNREDWNWFAKFLYSISDFFETKPRTDIDSQAAMCEYYCHNHSKRKNTYKNSEPWVDELGIAYNSESNIDIWAEGTGLL